MHTEPYIDTESKTYVVKQFLMDLKSILKENREMTNKIYGAYCERNKKLCKVAETSKRYVF